MSSKSKIIIGIVLLAVGGGLIPTGILTNDYLRDAVYDGVPDALLQIQDEAVSEIEELVPVLATPSALLGAKEEAIEGIKPMVAVAETPGILRTLKATMEAQIPYILTFTTAAHLLNLSYYWAEGTYGPGNGAEQFFNNPGYFDPYSQIGPSTFAGISMGYTPLAQQNLLFDGFYDSIIADYYSEWFPTSIPGLITDTTLGSGVGNYYSYFGTADYFANVVLDTYPKDVMMAKYNATWDQLGTLWAYFEYFLFPTVVPTAFLNNYGIDIVTAATYGFYFQWANGTFVPDGIDLSALLGLDSELKGVEAGVPAPTNISLANSIDLWNDSIPLSFANDDGIYAWLDGTVTNSTFGLDETQFAMVLSWLNNFITNVAPTLIENDQGVTMDRIGEVLFYEQWANGTIQGEVMVPGGFLTELGDEFEGPPYLEAGLQVPTNISLDATEDLWDEYNKLSFANGDGVEVWVGAATNTTLKALIKDEFNITSAEVDLLVEWLNHFIFGLNKFIRGKTLKLLEYATGYDLSQFSLRLFYEQWANGTINGEEVIPDGFLSMRDPPIYGPPYFELGIMYACGITFPQVEDLWRESSDYALTSVKGVNKWYKAKEGNDQWNELADEFDFDYIQMLAITTWLPEFRDTLVNKLAKDDMNLPMEPYDLGNTLFLTLLPIGSVLAVLGVVALILSRRS